MFKKKQKIDQKTNNNLQSNSSPQKYRKGPHLYRKGKQILLQNVAHIRRSL